MRQPKDKAIEVGIPAVPSGTAVPTGLNSTAISPTDKKILAMETSGVTRKLNYDRLFEGLNASKKFITSDERGEPIEKEEPDLLVRHKYLETSLRIYGDLKPDGGVNVLQVNLSKEESELLESYRKTV